MNYNVINGENEREYIWRIGAKVDSGELTWEEASAYINKNWRSDETEYRTSCAYRKAYKNAKDFYNDVFSSFENKDSDNLEEIRKERMKLQTVNNEYNNRLRKEARLDLFFESLADNIESLPMPALNTFPRPRINEKAYLLTLADIHYGADFKSCNNEYSPDICKERFGKLLATTIEKVRRDNIKVVNVLNLGDSIQGLIHLSDLRLNQFSVAQSVVEISRIIAVFLTELSKYCIVNYYHCPTANHSQLRPLGTKANELSQEDLEKVIINYVYDLVRGNDNICMTAPSVYEGANANSVDFRILNFNVCAYHGHTVKDKKTELLKHSMFMNKSYDFIFIGHNHQYSQVITEKSSYNAKFVTCAPFIGSCPYSDSLSLGGKAISNFFTFDATNGLVVTEDWVLN